MNKLILPIVLAGLLISCNESKKEIPNNVIEGQEEVIAETDNINWKDINTNEALVATALMAAPKKSKEDCTVIGYNVNGEFVTLKEGNNEFICLAEDLSKDGFSAACYHKSLEPFMARGRALKQEGKTHAEIFNIREEEVKSGKLAMGKPGATLHLYFGNDTKYNPETSEVKNAIYRYVVYLPFATSESTGLPETPKGSNHPWIMNPGSHKAHIMISPLADCEVE